MDELGSLLREAREAKGLSLVDVQEGTKINPLYLEALEDGRYNDLPTEVHVRGYLRNYARFLELDPEPLLDRYEISRESYSAISDPAADDEIGTITGPQREGQVFFDPVNMEISNGGGRDSGSSIIRIVLIIALIASIALVANRFLPLLTGNGDANDSLTASFEDAVSNITNELEQQPEPTSDLASGSVSDEPITSTSRNPAVVLPTATPTRPVLPATMDEIRMRLDVTERTWMRVTIDGEVAFEGLARKGDGPFEWRAEDEAQLLTGNAIGIFVTLNDIELGKLGGRGEVVDETWSTTTSG